MPLSRPIQLILCTLLSTLLLAGCSVQPDSSPQDSPTSALVGGGSVELPESTEGMESSADTGESDSGAQVLLKDRQPAEVPSDGAGANENADAQGLLSLLNTHQVFEGIAFVPSSFRKPIEAQGYRTKRTDEGEGGTPIRINVYEFSDEAAAQAVQDSITDNGYTIADLKVDWIGPPHFYRYGNCVLLYPGSSAQVLDALNSLLGEQFCGV